jgi:diguanylate cyclase (GGDEF)-like protein
MLTPKVLLVNDDPASLIALESLLAGATERGEYEVVTARSGEEALRHVLHDEFAVILLDVSMPIMDGFETAEAIHSHPRSASTPIIFITAHFADEMNRLKGYQKGAVDYLFTPVFPQVLQTKISVFVELTKKNLELQLKTEELAELNRDLRVQRMQDLERINNTLKAEVIERKQAEERARELAIRDSLTGLLNRRSLIDRLEHAVAHSARHHEKFAFLFLDLDKFKLINDTLGHETGDKLLRQVATRLNEEVRGSDVVARLGGDEFVVLLERLSNSNNANDIAVKIAQALARPYEIGTHTIHTSASIGVALYPQDGASVQSLMKNADLAMYHAKRKKRGSIQFFDEEINRRQAERHQLEHELRQALEKQEFELHYQPKVDIRSGRVCGVEALLRWRHPQRGLMTAQKFMKSLAESWYFRQISEWAIDAACAQTRRWLDSGLAFLNIPIAINIVFSHHHSDLTAATLEVIRKYKLPPSSVHLEIAQSQLVRDAEKNIALLREFHEAGLTLAIDDFGTGSLSLATLKTLPFDILKIDQSFIHELGIKEDSVAITAAIVNVARALALRVIAKGVETEEQLAILKTLGCDEYQGELFCAPLPADTLVLKLREIAHV